MRNNLRRLAMAAVAFATAAIVMAQGNPKATGSVYFDYGGDTYVSFNAHDLGDPMYDKGWLDWARPNGGFANYFGGPVINAWVDPFTGDAYFDVQIMYSTNYPMWVGDVLRFAVEDRGTPGRNGDRFRWVWQTGPYAGGDSGWVNVMGGNLVVHPK